MFQNNRQHPASSKTCEENTLNHYTEFSLFFFLTLPLINVLYYILVFMKLVSKKNCAANVGKSSL